MKYLSIIMLFLLTGCGSQVASQLGMPTAPSIQKMAAPLAQASKQAITIKTAAADQSILLQMSPVQWPTVADKIRADNVVMVNTIGLLQGNLGVITTQLQAALANAKLADQAAKANAARLQSALNQLSKTNRLLWGMIDGLGALLAIGGVLVIVAFKDGSLGLGLILAGLAGIAVGIGAAFLQSVLWTYMPWVAGIGGGIVVIGGIIFAVVWYERGSVKAASVSAKSIAAKALPVVPVTVAAVA